MTQLNAAQAARMCGVDRQTIVKAILHGELPAQVVRVGLSYQYQINEDALREWLRTKLNRLTQKEVPT